MMIVFVDIIIYSLFFRVGRVGRNGEDIIGQ